MLKKVRIPLLVILFLFLCWTAYDMHRLLQLEQLWGYRPLLLFSAGWGFLVLLLADRFSYLPDNHRLLGASTLSGLLLAFGFPGLLPLPFLIFFGFVPLFWIEKQISDKGTKRAGWQVFKYSYHALIIWNILSTYWVGNTSLPAGIFAIVVNSALMCIPVLLFHYAKKVMPSLGYLAFLVFWITFEYLHLNWELSWPWLTLGHSFAQFPSWIQWYEYTGAFGGSLWILLANIWIFQSLEKNSWQWEWQLFLRPAILIVLPIGVSLVQYFQYEETGETLDVLVIQPNFEPHFEKIGYSEEVQMERIFSLMESHLDEEVDYVVLPETSFGFVPTHQMTDYPVVQQIRALLQAYPKTKLMAGIDAVHYFKAGEEHSEAVREGRTRDGQTIYYEIINGAIQVGADIGPIPLYKKSKLVPGPEILPFRNVLFFLEPVVQSFGGTTAGVGTQPQRSVMGDEGVRIAPVICYESVFGEYHTDYIKKGAQAIFIMTNDGWWDHTAGHRQHLYFASLRAIETRRSIARSANTGISAFLNQRGDIQQPTDYEQTRVIRGTIHLNEEITFYVRWGDIIARLSLFTAGLLLLNTLVRKLKG